MTAIAPDGTEAKSTPQPLSARAARPLAVRLRGTPVKLAFALAVTVLAGSFVWAFVVEPRLKAIQAGAQAAKPPPASGSTRPSERITSQPASYEQPSAAAPAASALPPPRGGGVDSGPGEATVIASTAKGTVGAQPLN